MQRDAKGKETVKQETKQTEGSSSFTRMSVRENLIMLSEEEG
jgi:hypothetical protein